MFKFPKKKDKKLLEETATKVDQLDKKVDDIHEKIDKLLADNKCKLDCKSEDNGGETK